MKRWTFSSWARQGTVVCTCIKEWLAHLRLPRTLDVADVFYPCRVMQPVRVTHLDVPALQQCDRERLRTGLWQDWP